jgi:4-carboxymuconolactone decarboxylase
MAKSEEWLRRLVLHDQTFIGSVLAMDLRQVAAGLDAKTQALVRLAVLLAADAEPTSYQCTVEIALGEGATPDEVVGVLMAAAPLIGLIRVVSATPHVALSLGYDIDAAFEAFNGEPNDRHH